MNRWNWLVRVGEWAVLLPLWRRFIKSQGWRIAAASGVGLLWVLLIIGIASGGGGDDGKDKGGSATDASAAASSTGKATGTAIATPEPTATVKATESPTAAPTAPPTQAPTPVPTPAPTAAPTQAPTQPPTYDYACEAAASCNCPDFPTHAEAQRIFDLHGGGSNFNWAGLDNNHDGIACEDLP